MADRARARIGKEKKVALSEEQEQLLDRLMEARGVLGDISKFSDAQKKELDELELAKYKEELKNQYTTEESVASSFLVPQVKTKPTKIEKKKKT